VDIASKKPNIGVQGSAQSGLGEIYARAGKVPEQQPRTMRQPSQSDSGRPLLKNEAVTLLPDQQRGCPGSGGAMKPSRPIHAGAAVLP